MGRVLVAVVVGALVEGPLAAATAAEVTGEVTGEVDGTATAIDGRTLEIDGERIRLAGIDAPDRDQRCLTGKGEAYPCGEHAGKVLATMVRNHRVTCRGDDRDADGALIASCLVGPFDLGELMVAEGWAVAAPGSGSAYERAQRAAKARLSGLWKGTFELPWEWRQRPR